MENYIFNKNTIAVLKSKKKTVIIDVDNIRVINKNINNIINNNCLLYGSSLNGRKEYAKDILNKTYKLPIFINDNIMLLQINSIRDKNCLFIVLNKFINYKIINNNLLIELANYNYLLSNLSANSFEKIIINGIKINNKIKSKKITNFV